MPRKNSRARRRPARRTSNIEAARQSAFERTEQRKEQRTREQEAAAKKAPAKPFVNPFADQRLEPRTSTPMMSAGRGVPQDLIRKRDENLRKQSEGGQRAPGTIPTPGTGRITDPLVDPKLYTRTGQEAFDAGALARTSDGKPITLQQVQQQAALLKAGSRAVYMGKGQATLGGGNLFDPTVDLRPNRRPPVTYDNFMPIESLMAWLVDPNKVEEIKQRAHKAGLNVQSYEEISQLWGKVVQMAAQTYTATGRKVTPWDIMTVRGKHEVDTSGRPKKRTGRSVTVEDIDPATARLMIEDAVSKMTGQRPSEDQLDQFVAKARQIARATPLVENFSQEVNFAGEPVEDTLTVTSREGGQEVAKDRFEAEMLDRLRQSPEYAQYRSAAFYGPLLFDALNSPVQ